MAKQKWGFFDDLKVQFSPKTLALIPITVGINLIGSTIASMLKLPLFLDIIGTIMSAALAGPWAAALVGLLTNLFLALLSNPVYLTYSLVNVGCGLVTGYMIRGGMFKRVWGVVLTCLSCTAISAMLSSAITVFVYGGATGATGSSVFTAALIAATKDIVKSVVTTSFIENLVDRSLTFLIVVILLKRIPKRFLSISID